MTLVRDFARAIGSEETVRIQTDIENSVLPIGIQRGQLIRVKRNAETFGLVPIIELLGSQGNSLPVVQITGKIVARPVTIPIVSRSRHIEIQQVHIKITLGCRVQLDVVERNRHAAELLIGRQVYAGAQGVSVVAIE